MMNKVIINLQRGSPNPSLLPATQVKAASAAAFSDTDTLQSGLLYGENAGYEPLRWNLATWLTEFYKPQEPITPLRLAITGGASQNLACILQTFSDPSFTSVWLVSPVYFLACGIFEDNGFHGRMRSVPEDEEGIDIAYLQRELVESDTIAETVGKAKPVSGRPYQIRLQMLDISLNSS
jgi:DNA-binding transcriptional MocR family regulator